MDGTSFPGRFLSSAAGIFPEAYFPGVVSIKSALCRADSNFRKKLGRNQRSHFFSRHHSLNISRHVQIKDHDRQVVLLAE